MSSSRRKESPANEQTQMRPVSLALLALLYSAQLHMQHVLTGCTQWETTGKWRLALPSGVSSATDCQQLAGWQHVKQRALPAGVGWRAYIMHVA